MIITKRPFKLKQVLMNLEPGQISVDANNRDSLIKMGREAGVGGRGVGWGREASSGRVQAFAFSHSSYRFTRKEICDESGTSWYRISCFAVYTQRRELEMKISWFGHVIGCLESGI